MNEVILYYNFSRIDDPETFVDQHKQRCRELGLLGRVYISKEGINGTLGGPVSQIDEYKKYLRSIEGLEDTEFKEDASETIPFAKLIVKQRPEIVTLKVDDELNPQQEGGRYLSPREWRQIIENEEDLQIIDVRNDYESRIGHFEGAITPQEKNFYDFPKWLEEADLDKNKKTLMYCTGGIRCEKFSILMQKHGFKDVNQLHGGILNYAKEEGGKYFRGKCFVFDDRLVVPVNPEDEEPIAHCEITGEPCDMYINCANMECNKLFICSPEGARQMEGCCCEECRQSEYKRPFDAEQAYAPFRKWYHYFDDDFKQRRLQHENQAD